MTPKRHTGTALARLQSGEVQGYYSKYQGETSLTEFGFR